MRWYFITPLVFLLCLAVAIAFRVVLGWTGLLGSVVYVLASIFFVFLVYCVFSGKLK